MPLESDLLVDRARLQRRIALWRVLAVLGFTCLALVLVGRAVRSGPHIARLTVDGIITDDSALADRVDRLARDGSVRALLISIDSPGGSAAGGVALHDAIVDVAAHKPVVAVMGGEAASAGYMIAVPAARVFANPATLTGSIGVILEAPDASGLLGKIGITDTQIVSGPLKGQPSLVAPLSPAGKTYLQGLVDDMFDQFVTMVAEGRHMPKARVLQLADGRAYSGRQALALGLIDQFGTERDARHWLAANRGVAFSVPVRDLSEHDRFDFDGTRSTLPAPLGMLMNCFFPQRVTLDGLVALWQP
jgi:protease-4